MRATAPLSAAPTRRVCGSRLLARGVVVGARGAMVRRARVIAIRSSRTTSSRWAGDAKGCRWRLSSCQACPRSTRRRRSPSGGELDHGVVGADRGPDQGEVVEADGGVQVAGRGEGLGVAAQVGQAGQPAAYLGPGDVSLSGAQGQGVL